MLKPLIPIGIVAAVLVGLLVYSQVRHEPLKVSGFIESNEIRIGSRVGGRVLKVHVVEGQAVHKGDVLVELEPFQLYEQKSQAEAQLAQARADFDQFTTGYRPEEIGQAKAHRDQLAATLEKLVNGPREEDISSAESQLTPAKDQLELSQKKYQRMEELFAKKAATPQDVDEATADLRVARATKQVREEELLKLKRGTRKEELEEAKAQLEEATQAWELRKSGYRKEELAKSKATVQAFEAALRAYERQIEELTVRAPVDGTVEAIDLQPGDLVGANTAAISMMDTGSLWVRAYLPENLLRVQVGEKLWITVDSFPGKKYAAHLTFIARQAEFTPGNVQTPEDRSKQVFRIKVELDDGLKELRPGMSADVWLDAERMPQ